MAFRLNFIITSLCIVIGLPTSATYGSEEKSRPLHLISWRPLDVISTGSIAIPSADGTHIHPSETTSCTVNSSAEYHFVHCRGKKQNTRLTLTGSTAVRHLTVETGATTWVRNHSTICRISSNNEAPDVLYSPPSPPLLDSLFPELAGLEQNNTLLTESSDLEQDNAFSSVLRASAGEGIIDTDDTLNKVSQIPSDSGPLPTKITRMRKPRAHTKDRPFVCDQDKCYKAFTTLSDLTIHKRTHTGDRPFVCDQCNWSFTQSCNLIRHKRTHTGNRPFVCDFNGCNKAFTSSSNLSRHKRTHTGNKPFVCNQDGCNKRFSQSSDLIRHQRIHTGEKPFVCDLDGCDKSFTTPSHLTRHKHTQHCRKAE
ncbi:C2H2-type zinc finger protein [Sansalvadorimonas verongulae]|nr:C2H2-type zinc finger protein [Sansalvadorimonas verongulae]